MTGLCDWPVSYAQCSSCDVLDSADEGERARFEAMAVEYLWYWTGRAFGLCPAIIRPCRQDCNDLRGWYDRYRPGAAWEPALVGGVWMNLSCGRCGDPCSCDGKGVAALKLPGPISSVQKVTIDGEVLADTAYRVDNHFLLVRQDGGSWPKCQDMAQPVTEQGTWEVQYTRGVQVPMGGQVAAGVLACEMAKAACGDKE